jgi:hypothetical protein
MQPALACRPLQSIYDLFIALWPKPACRPTSHQRRRPHWSGAQAAILGRARRVSTISIWRKLAHLDRDALVTVEGGREACSRCCSSEKTPAPPTAPPPASITPSLLAELPPELRTSAATLGPLFRGETVVAALPFAFGIK